MPGFGDFARHRFDFSNIFWMGVSVLFAVGTDVGEVRLDVLAGEQNKEAQQAGARLIRDYVFRS